MLKAQSGQEESFEAATATDSRWAAVVGRDAACDGSFFYAVKTTGVFCRPSCAARTPRRENVRFFETAAAAVAAGFRPCLRCHPGHEGGGDVQAGRIARVCRMIEASEQTPTLDELAREVGLSPFHLQRLFKARTGVSPNAYARSLRAARVRSALGAGEAVTDALHAAGYGSSSRFYEAAGRELGMKPAAYRAGGAAERIRFAVGECSLGAILVASTERGVCAILMGDDPEALVRDLQDRFRRAELLGADGEYEQVVATVVGFVERPAIGLALPLDLRGTVFQMRVWQALRELPVGRTATYTEIAQKIGAPAAVRAVAGACAANPLAVAVPCHRVVRNDGALAGYRWGVERKRTLLERERKE